jgi:nucleotide-binding universal stress UspA family protein
MLRKIVVPLDGSSFAEQALPWARSIARRADAALDLVQVHVSYAVKEPTPRAIPYDSALESEGKQQEQLYLDSTAKWLGALSPVRLTTALVPGQPADGILRRVRDLGADLVVMTTHGRGPVGRFFLGSVATELLRRAKIPLFLVRPNAPAPGLIPEPAPQHVLIPLDGSALAEHIVDPALELAGLSEARCTLLRVVEIQSGLPDSAPGTAGSPGEVHVEAAQTYLAAVARELAGRGIEVQTRVVPGRNVADTIFEQAHAQTYDLIALATHGRGGVGRMLLGSVADQVIQGATVPVLAFRPPEA